MDSQALKPLYETLQRYAGWLDHERCSATVRADVQALGAAIDISADPTPLLQALDANLARLPGSELRKLLRAASARMRRAVEEQAFRG